MSNLTGQKVLKYHKAFKEVYILINDLNPDLYFRIPKNFIDIIKKNMDESYDISLEELNNKGYMEETEAIMSLIYRDFICCDELNQKLLKHDKEQIEYEIERYNNIFDNDDKNEKVKQQQINEIEYKNNKEEQKEETSLVVVKEENIFVKIIKKIKSMFKRK